MYINFTYDEGFMKLYYRLVDLYPQELFKINGIDDDHIDITKYSKNYFLKKAPTADKTIDQNSNVQSSHVATYNSERFKAHAKLNSLFILWKMIQRESGVSEANRLIESEFKKDINIQDSYQIYIPYCWNFATYDLVVYGLPFIENLPSDPPKHADTFLQHTIQLCMYASNQLLGATSIGDILVVYSKLLQKDSLDPEYPVYNYKKEKKLFERYLKQEFQKLVYTLNQPVRQTQSLFSNITIFDNIFLKEMISIYGEFDVEFAMYIQKKFLDYFNEFNHKQLFTFPVLTIQFKKNENNDIEDEEFFNYICNHNLEFANLNIFSTKNLTALSSCCRLQSNVEDLIKETKEENTNLIGGSTLKVGSFGVTTINLPRISLQVKDLSEEVKEKVFFEVLKHRTQDCIKINNYRRLIIKDMIDKKQLPLYDYNFIRLENQYSTVGLNGFYECVEIYGYDILSKEGKEFGIKILNTIQEVIEEKIHKYKYKINCEQIPAESTAIKFVKADKIFYKQDKYHLYSNQFIPLVNETDLIHRIELQALFENYFTGGTILHVNVGQKIESAEVMKKLMSYVIKKGVQYFAINYFFQKCEDNHITIGDDGVCPVCSKNIIDNITRIVGFLTPISSWQKERKEEFGLRKKYNNGSLKVKEDI